MHAHLRSHNRKRLLNQSAMLNCMITPLCVNLKHLWSGRTWTSLCLCGLWFRRYCSWWMSKKRSTIVTREPLALHPDTNATNTELTRLDTTVLLEPFIPPVPISKHYCGRRYKPELNDPRGICFWREILTEYNQINIKMNIESAPVSWKTGWMPTRSGMTAVSIVKISRWWKSKSQDWSNKNIFKSKPLIRRLWQYDLLVKRKMTSD